jgi:nucleoside-diphosphate-sugar epimerase
MSTQKIDSKVLPIGSTVFVTGAAGFIGAAVSSELLKAGYKVRAATRSIAKAEPLKKRFDAEFGEGAFEVVHVDDFARPGAYDEVLKGVSGVAHIAADISQSPDVDFVVKNTIKGIHNILRAASKISTIKRFVLTSSRIAIFNPNKGDNYKVDKKAYFDAALKMAQDLPSDNPIRSLFSYAAGKTEGERAAWKFVDEEKPSFTFNTVLPDLVIGEIINPGSEGSTAGMINKIFTEGNTDGVMGFVSPPSFYVDVKDTARIHLAALTEPDVQNERLWALAGQFTLNQILDIGREVFPNRTTIPKNYEGFDEPCQIQVDTSRELQLLKRQGRLGWVSLKDSLLEQVKGL